MHSLFGVIPDHVLEYFGHPASLIRLLEQYPDLRVDLSAPSPSIGVSNIVQWHKLGDTSASSFGLRQQRGTLMGWKVTGDDHYRSCRLHRPEFEQMVHKQIVDDWECDIADVHGFAAYKSELNEFASTDQMAETKCPDLIDEISQENLAKNLAHREIRIIHHANIDYFARHLWDDRLFLMNDGGSHHFAAAKYIATRLPQSVPLKGKLYTYSLNALAIESLRADYEMFVISDAAVIACDFHRSMEAFRATWLWFSLPLPYEHAKGVFFPKNEPRSRRVANRLRHAGVVDLGLFLTNLAASQVSPRAETFLHH